MQAQTRITLLAVCISAAACLFNNPTANAAFVVRFDPTMTRAISNGTTQAISVGLLIDYSDDGRPNTLSSFTLDLANPGPGLTPSNATVASYNWDNGPLVSQDPDGNFQLLAANFATGNVTVPAGQRNVLMTLEFLVDSRVTDQVFPLDLMLRDASRNIFTDIAPEFTLQRGQFVVASIPEPASMGLIAMTTGYVILRNRRTQRTRR